MNKQKTTTLYCRLSKKDCAIYLRVSTEEQHPENQIADVRRFAEALGYRVVEVYIDKESGGYSDRKEFQRMMMDAEAGKFQTLFIWALDRFSREGIKATLTHIERLKEIGVALKSYQESWLDTANEGIWQLLVAVLSWAAKEELKRFVERSMAGKRTRLANNKLIGCYPPYGYTHVKRDKEKGTDAYFKINPQEASVVKKIFKLYLKLESIFMVAKKLSEMGIKNRGKGGQPKFFHTSTVKKILGSETYIGNWYYGKSSPCIAKYHIKQERKHKLTGRRMNPKSEWKLVKIPAIIDNKTFNVVQQILKRRYRQNGKESKFPVLCKGLIRCVDCGRLYGAKGHRKYKIYRCPQAYGLDFNEPPCHSRSMMCHKLDAIIWNFVSDLISDKEKVKAKLRLSEKKREKDRASSQRFYNALLSEKEGLKTKTSRLLELYSDNEVSKEDLKVKLAEVKEREFSLDGQIIDIERGLKEMDNIEAMEREVEKICDSYQNGISRANFEEKRYIVHKWIREINLLKDGRILIKANVPQLEASGTIALSVCPVCPTTTYLAQGNKKVIFRGRSEMASQESPKFLF